MHAYHLSNRGARQSILPVLFLFLSFSILAQDIQLSASVDRNPVSLNETFTYKAEVSGTTQNLPEINLPDLSNFTLISGPSQSSSFNMTNGAVTTSKAYTVELVPKKNGTFTFAPISVTHRGKTYKSNAVKLIVSNKSNTSGKNVQSGSSNSPFMRAVATKRNVYENEPFNVSFKVYFRNPIRNLNYIKQPETIGFWVEEFDIPANIPVSKEVINGVEYNVAEVKKLALFPTKSGALTISPMQLSVNIQQKRRRRSNIFDDFFSDPLGRTVRKVLSSRALTINVKPLPANVRPLDFDGLVGRFSISASMDKTSGKANEAFSYKLQLRGNGNLKSLNRLSPNFPKSFEVYDPKTKDNTNLSSGYFQASRELEYVLIPRSAGEFRIKPLAIPYFDPSSGSYKMLTTKEYNINVAEGAEMANGIGNSYLSKSDVELLGQDIHFIKEDRLNLLPIDYQPYKSGWFWLALAFPLVGLIVAYGAKNYAEKMTTNVEYARKRKALSQASKRLKSAESLLKAKKYPEFYGEVAKGLIGFVADKTNRAAAGLLRNDVAELLKTHHVDEALSKDYLKYLDEADFRRFAASSVNGKDATAFYQQSLEMLSKIGKFFK